MEKYSSMEQSRLWWRGVGGGLKEYVCSLLTCHNLEELCTAAVALVLCMYMYVYVFISDRICNVIAY